MNRVSPPGALYMDRLQVLVQSRSITASKCISANSLDRGLQVYVPNRSITPSKFAQSWPPSAYLQTRSITASKCISKITRIQPPRSRNHLPPSVYLLTGLITASSASPNSLEHGLQLHLQTHLITASKCISPNLLNHSLQLYLQIRSITTSKWISKLAPSRPRSVSLSSHGHRFQAHL